ncbi:MAG: hypothetical protein WDW38_009970 [Sanguina aurantia]
MQSSDATGSAGESRRHLIPLDETAASESVVLWTIENLYRAGDTIHLYRVLPAGQFTVLGGDLTIMPEIIEEDPAAQKAKEESACAYIAAHFELKLVGHKIPYEVELVRCYVDNDALGACICSRAEQLGACTVVMAKHPKGAVVEFFVGSVTSYCVHHATCPVVVLHVG